MSLIPWKNKSASSIESNPWGDLRTEMNRLFDSVVREPFGSLAESFANGWGPSIDVSEDASDVTVRVELPGVKPDDIDLTVTGNRLIIKGEKKDSIEKQDRDYSQRETRFGTFSRSLELPVLVDSNDVNADFNHGVLTVRIKKSPQTSARKINVNPS